MFGDGRGRAVFKSATSVPEARRLPNDWHPMLSITMPLPGQLPPHSQVKRALITPRTYSADCEHMTCKTYIRCTGVPYSHETAQANATMQTTNSNMHCTYRQHEYAVSALNSDSQLIALILHAY